MTDRERWDALAANRAKWEGLQWTATRRYFGQELIDVLQAGWRDYTETRERLMQEWEAARIGQTQ